MQVWCSHYETRCVFLSIDGHMVLFDYANHSHLVEGIPLIKEYLVMPMINFLVEEIVLLNLQKLLPIRLMI